MSAPAAIGGAVAGAALIGAGIVKVARWQRAESVEPGSRKVTEPADGTATNAVEATLSEFMEQPTVGLTELAARELRASEEEADRLICTIEDVIHEAAPDSATVPLSVLIGVQLGKRLAAGELDVLLS